MDLGDECRADMAPLWGRLTPYSLSRLLGKLGLRVTKKRVLSVIAKRIRTMSGHGGHG
jgi:hypothetical protein